MNPLTQFIYDWQQLAGAFLGPFLAIIFSAIGFLITRKIKKETEYRETLRRIEVNSTYSLNSTYTMQVKLAHFVKSARKLVTDIKAVTSPKHFSLEHINFPALGEIHLDTEIPNLLVKSYYLHNKLLWAHAGIKDVNGVIGMLGTDWSNLLTLNQKYVDLELKNNNPNPPLQRDQYSSNIQAFADEIERFSKEELEPGINILVQIKVYNDLLRKRFPKGLMSRWKYEGLSFKYFPDLAAFKNFVRNLESIDRIDKEIQKDVDQAVINMQERAAKLKAEKQKGSAKV